MAYQKQTLASVPVKLDKSAPHRESMPPENSNTSSEANL